MSRPWTRCVRFVAVEDGKTYYGDVIIPSGSLTSDVGLLYRNRQIQPLQARLLSASPLSPHCALLDMVLTVNTLLTPLATHEVPNILGLGAQFLDPKTLIPPPKPKIPVLFYKPTTTLIGVEERVILPRNILDQEIDHEVELAVILSRDAKNVREQDADEYILGYATSNDVTARALMRSGCQSMGKAYDTWTPWGPALISPEALPEGKTATNLKLSSSVNGKMKQAGSTADMVLNIAELISKLSAGVTLQAGSIILTGSPYALDQNDSEKLFLRHKDEISCAVEGCGTLFNSAWQEDSPEVETKSTKSIQMLQAHI